MTLPAAIIQQQKQYMCSLTFAHKEQSIEKILEKDVNCHDNLV